MEAQEAFEPEADGLMEAAMELMGGAEGSWEIDQRLEEISSRLSVASAAFRRRPVQTPPAKPLALFAPAPAPLLLPLPLPLLLPLPRSRRPLTPPPQCQPQSHPQPQPQPLTLARCVPSRAASASAWR